MQQSPSPTLRSRGFHRGWVPRYSAVVELNPRATTATTLLRGGGVSDYCLMHCHWRSPSITSGPLTLVDFYQKTQPQGRKKGRIFVLLNLCDSQQH
jgi:hypothetical protein